MVSLYQIKVILHLLYDKRKKYARVLISALCNYNNYTISSLSPTNRLFLNENSGDRRIYDYHYYTDDT